MIYYQFYNNIPVINYHKVSDKKELGLGVVSIKAFKEQMCYLKEEGYATILSTDYDSTRSSKPVIITFDDAYTDVFDTCLTIMEELSLKGIVFPVVNFIGKENLWDANLGGITFRHLNLDQLKILSESGWEIGSHSLNHISFLHAKELKKEIYDSKKKLEDITGNEVTCFSYPFGRVTNITLQMVERVYKYAFIAKMTKKTDALRISRFSVYGNDNINSFKAKLNGAFFNLWKSNLIHKGAVATELYQFLFRNKLKKQIVY